MARSGKGRMLLNSLEEGASRMLVHRGKRNKGQSQLSRQLPPTWSESEPHVQGDMLQSYRTSKPIISSNRGANPTTSESDEHMP